MRLGAATPWYLGRALRGGGAIGRGARAGACTLAAGAVVALAGCGGPARQDVDEPAGTYPVEITEARFPTAQKLARTSNMRITVRNAGRKTIPQVSVSVRPVGKGGGGAGGASANSPGGFNYHDPKTEDPNKPIFVINKEPKGGETGYVDTWALGAIRPGREKTFVWEVTAVKAQPFDLRYRVSAGLDGKAKAVVAGTGELPEGHFRGTITSKAPDAKVADRGGEDVISGGTRYRPRQPERVLGER